jgi:hypothetical protein
MSCPKTAVGNLKRAYYMQETRRRPNEQDVRSTTGDITSRLYHVLGIQLAGKLKLNAWLDFSMPIITYHHTNCFKMLITRCSDVRVVCFVTCLLSLEFHRLPWLNKVARKCFRAPLEPGFGKSAPSSGRKFIAARLFWSISRVTQRKQKIERRNEASQLF